MSDHPRSEPSLKEWRDANKDVYDTLVTWTDDSASGWAADCAALIEDEIAKRCAKLDDFDPEDVSTRVKEWDSIEPKIEEGRGVWLIGDLVGARVVTTFGDETARVLFSLSDLTDANPVTRAWNSGTGRKAGYAGTHTQIDVPPPRPEPPREVAEALAQHEELFETFHPGFTVEQTIRDLHQNFTAELQVRTGVQHVWSELSHHRGLYKSSFGVPADVRRRLHRLAASLDHVGEEIMAIRDEVAELAKSPDSDTLDELKRCALDEHYLVRAANFPGGHFGKLREWSREIGFRSSDWPEHVRPGHETDLFLDFAESCKVRTVEDIWSLINRREEFDSDLRGFIARLRHRTGSNQLAFARPLYVLAMMLVLDNPGKVCRGFREDLQIPLMEQAVESWARRSRA